MKNEKTEKPRFELVILDGSSRVRCMHANEARAKYASTTSRRVLEALKIARECWEQHVEEGTFNFYSNRKYTAEDCGEVPSFKVKRQENCDSSA